MAVIRAQSSPLVRYAMRVMRNRIAAPAFNGGVAFLLSEAGRLAIDDRDHPLAGAILIAKPPANAAR